MSRNRSILERRYPHFCKNGERAALTNELCLLFVARQQMAGKSQPIDRNALNCILLSGYEQHPLTRGEQVVGARLRAAFLDAAGIDARRGQQLCIPGKAMPGVVLTLPP